MITLTTSPQLIGSNTSSTIHTYLYAWYSNQSGNTATVHARLTVKSVGITYTGTNKSYSLNLGGYNSGTQSWSYAPLVAGTEYTVSEATWGYAGGDTISAGAGFWSYAYGSADIALSDTVALPTFASAPTGLTVTVGSVHTDGAEFNVSITSYGNPASVNGRFIEAGIAGQNSWTSPSLRSAIETNTKSAEILVNNSSTKTTTLTIKPNKQYWYGGAASNTQASREKIFGQFVTLAVCPAISIAGRTSDSVTLRYVAAADGGYYNKTVQYSVNGGEWTTAVVITTGNATTGTFIINNLTAGEEYTIQTRVVTTAGTMPGQTIVLDNKSINLYGGVNDAPVLIHDIYGSDNSQSVRITKLYGALNGETKLIHQGFGHINYQ